MFRLLIVPTLALFLLTLAPTHGYTSPISRRRAFGKLVAVPSVVLPALVVPSANAADDGDDATTYRRSKVQSTSKYLKAQSSYVTSNDFAALKASLRSPPFDTFRKTARSPQLSDSEQKVRAVRRSVATIDERSESHGYVRDSVVGVRNGGGVSTNLVPMCVRSASSLHPYTTRFALTSPVVSRRSCTTRS